MGAVRFAEPQGHATGSRWQRSRTVAYPRGYADLRAYAGRHPSVEARAVVQTVDGLVERLGWREAKRRGGAELKAFYSAAAEVFQEVAGAAAVGLTPIGLGRLGGRWKFRFPVEDIVLDLLHRADPESRIVIVDGSKAYVRDGFGVFIDKAERYAGLPPDPAARQQNPGTHSPLWQRFGNPELPLWAEPPGKLN